jgi:type IV pilus assembly protein PilO
MRIKGIDKIFGRYRGILVVLLNFVILAGGYFLFLNSKFEERNRLKVEINSAQQELSKLTAIEKNLPRARQEYAELRNNLDVLLKQMPEEKEVPNLLRQVSFTAQEAKTRIKYFAPRDAQSKEFYAELPFDIKYSGSYHSLGYFFDGIRKLERIIHVTSFSLEAKGAGERTVLDGSCIAKTYVSMKTGQAAQKRQGKEEKKKP